MRLRNAIIVLAVILMLLTGCGAPSQPTEMGVPGTSASAITSPPSSMEGINTHTGIFGTGADSAIITLGPKNSTHPDWEPYVGKISVEFELEHGTPVLAPVDMVLIGFSNRNAAYRIQSGQKRSPYNDLMLCFESASHDWPGMIICVYHLLSSPLLRGHYRNPDCGECDEWGDITQAQGHLYFDTNDYEFSNEGNARSCEALIGYTVKRGELIGFAGSVGDHSMASFCFKVAHTAENPTVTRGNRYLHWVQPDAFFYWKCYSPGTDFPAGVLAYPFECNGYSLPAEQRDVDFKYAAQ